MCDNKEQLVGYLYDELEAGERRAFAAHLSTCADCREEIAGLGQARDHLKAWAPPEPELDFQVVRRPVAVTDPVAAPRRFRAIPQWAMAAAASLLVLAGAAAIAQVEVRYGADGLVVRTGWGATPGSGPVEVPPGATPGPQAVPAGTSSEETRQLIAAFEKRLQELEQSRPAPTAAASTAAGTITAAELRKVLAASEARQREEMALHVAQVWKDFSAARVSDLTRLQDVIGRAQGVTNQQLRQHRESIESLYRVSLQR